MILRDEVTLSPSHHVQSYNIRLKLQTECIKKTWLFCVFLVWVRGQVLFWRFSALFAVHCCCNFLVTCGWRCGAFSIDFPKRQYEIVWFMSECLPYRRERCIFVEWILKQVSKTEKSWRNSCLCLPMWWRNFIKWANALTKNSFVPPTLLIKNLVVAEEQRGC